MIDVSVGQRTIGNEQQDKAYKDEVEVTWPRGIVGGGRICKLTVSVMKPSPINGYRTFGVCNPFGSWNETVQVVRSFCPWVTNLPLGKRVSNRQDKYDCLYA